MESCRSWDERMGKEVSETVRWVQAAIVNVRHLIRGCQLVEVLEQALRQIAALPEGPGTAARAFISPQGLCRII